VFHQLASRRGSSAEMFNGALPKALLAAARSLISSGLSKISADLSRRPTLLRGYSSPSATLSSSSMSYFGR